MYADRITLDSIWLRAKGLPFGAFGVTPMIFDYSDDYVMM